MATYSSVYFVYILVCLRSRRSYVGQTDNLVRRFGMHRAGSTRTTREKLLEPVMIHWEAHPTRSDAMKKERYFKAGAGHRVKLALISQALPLFPDAVPDDSFAPKKGLTEATAPTIFSDPHGGHSSVG